MRQRPRLLSGMTEADANNQKTDKRWNSDLGSVTFERLGAMADWNTKRLLRWLAIHTAQREETHTGIA